MKPAEMRDHAETINSDKNKDLEYFKMLEQELRAQPNLNAFYKSSVGADSEEGIKASYSIFPTDIIQHLSYRHHTASLLQTSYSISPTDIIQHLFYRHHTASLLQASYSISPIDIIQHLSNRHHTASLL